MKQIKLLIISLFVIAFASSSAFAATPKLIAAKFHADWCGSCETIKPAHMEIKKEFTGKDVLFVTFDKTDDVMSHNSELLANALGLDQIYAENQKTGFILLVNAETKEVVGKLTKAQTKAEMAEAINAALPA